LLDPWLQSNLLCPRDHRRLEVIRDELACPAGHRYPVLNGVPVMLLEEVVPTHLPHQQATFEKLACVQRPCFDDKSSSSTSVMDPNSVDPYVQENVVRTCGQLYKPLVHSLHRYPIPEIPLPKVTGKYLLDIGCNWGRWCVAAANKGYTPVGIDTSLDAILAAQRIARQLCVPAKYLVADARYLPFRLGCFDVVFSYSVLQHFSKEDTALALMSIARVLKPGAKSLVQMANRYGLRSLYNRAKRKLAEPKGFEVRYWKPSEINRTFEATIGPSRLQADAYFGLGIQTADRDLLPRRYRLVVASSELLKVLSRRLSWLVRLADSIYVQSSPAAKRHLGELRNPSLSEQQHGR
jgi:2-polyprenyl-3-methyl-5-hydroxy-6-metoxy-1,4-benzoquinol methylase